MGGFEEGMECEVCGGTDFYKESGHFYCNECQTQSQQVQEHVFEREDVNKKSSRKIQTPQKDKPDEVLLTSWECYNYILKGLTNELLELGAKPQIKPVVKCIWMKYLQKCQVFDMKSDTPPKLGLLGPRKDVEILYNIKKRKRRRRASSASSENITRQRSRKRRALILSQYDELSQSQSLTQDSLGTGTLSGLKSDSETSQGSRSKITFNKYSKRQLQKIMSKNHSVQHQKDFEGTLTCHKINSKSFSTYVVSGPTNLTWFVLYGILYVALLITGDSIQLGDMLRFLREGHLSYTSFRHFFPSHISEKSLGLPQRPEKLFSHYLFRNRCMQLVKFLDLATYITTPDLKALCMRYCVELNLPESICQCAQKLISLTSPKMALRRRGLPNYEARAMSFIVFTLKLLFGLDGVTEGKLAYYSQLLNAQAESQQRMFDIKKWLQFLQYRKAVVKKYHFPTAINNKGGHVDSDLFLKYWTNQKVEYRGLYKNMKNEVKDYLQVFDKLVEDGGLETSYDAPQFQPSPTPFRSYTDLLVKYYNDELADKKDELLENFQEDSLDFLLRPERHLDRLGCNKVKNGGANDDIVTEDFLHVYNAKVNAYRETKKVAAVKICDNIEGDKNVTEYLLSLHKDSLKTTDIAVLFSNWKECHKKSFESQQAEIYGDKFDLNGKEKEGEYPEHFHPFQRYWMNLSFNSATHFLTDSEMDALYRNMAPDLKTILEEVARVIEQQCNWFYGEFLLTELFLAYFEGYAGANGKNKRKGLIGLQKTLNAIRRYW